MVLCEQKEVGGFIVRVKWPSHISWAGLQKSPWSDLRGVKHK